jgi:hypothetical protein
LDGERFKTEGLAHGVLLHNKFMNSSGQEGRRSPFGNLWLVLALVLGAARPRADQVALFSECGNAFAAFWLVPSRKISSRQARQGKTLATLNCSTAKNTKSAERK